MAHPAFDRHGLTREREMQHAAGQPQPSPTVDLADTNRLLRELVTQGSTGKGITQLCVTDREPAQGNLENFPVAGSKRVIVRRTGDGGQIPIAQNVWSPVCPGVESRLGAYLTVSGATGVTLALTTDLLEPGSNAPLTEGCPFVWVAPNTAWDFQLGPSLLWCGAVMAFATAATSICLAEV